MPVYFPVSIVRFLSPLVMSNTTLTSLPSSPNISSAELGRVGDFAVGKEIDHIETEETQHIHQVLVAAAHTVEIRLYLPPLHTPEKIVGVAAPFTYDIFVEVEGCQTFFGVFPFLAGGVGSLPRL